MRWRRWRRSRPIVPAGPDPCWAVDGRAELRGVITMLTVVLVCLGFVPDDGARPPAPGAPDRAAYETAASKAGRDASSHVRLALWCEQHGMTAERVKHLTAAALYDPSNALARGLMGLVAYNGKWERPDDVSREARDDPKRKALMDEYLQRRA